MAVVVVHERWRCWDKGRGKKADFSCFCCCCCCDGACKVHVEAVGQRATNSTSAVEMCVIVLVMLMDCLSELESIERSLLPASLLEDFFRFDVVCQ